MKYLLSISFLLTLSLFIIPCNVTAQGDFIQSESRSGEGAFDYEPYFARRSDASTNIKDLKNGTLIVRLISFNEKVEILKKQGRVDKANEVIQENEKNIKSFMQEFQDDYNFSDIVFCYGVDLENHLDGKAKNIFLNKDLKIDPSITIKDGPIFILGSQSNGSYFLYNTDFIRIARPAPYVMNFEEKAFKFDAFRLFSLFSKNPVKRYTVKDFNTRLTRISFY